MEANHPFGEETHMQAVEFQTKIVDGRIELPDSLQNRFQGEVRVIIFPGGSENDSSTWPEQNRRRWELIVKKVREGLSTAETEELDELQQVVDAKLAQIGPRPIEELQRMYDQLTQQE
jgi:hypothetical protein